MVTRDTFVTVKMITPGGLIVRLNPDDLPFPINADETPEGEATRLSSLTGCPITIEVLHVTTVRP